MKIPYRLLKLLPMWDYICPVCRKTVAKNSHTCPHCHEKYPFSLKVPPQILKDKKALETYVHKHVFPRVSEFERAYLTKYFTVLFSDGFETGNFTAWTGGTLGNPSVVSSPVHSGSYACSCPNSGDRPYEILASTYADLFARTYVRFASTLALGSAVFLDIRFSGLADAVEAIYSVSAIGIAYWVIQNIATSGWYSAAATINANQWYCVEMERKVGSLGLVRLWVDGNLIIDQSDTVNSNGQTVFVGNLGSPASFSLYVDDIVVADAYIGPTVANTGTLTVTATVAGSSVTTSISVGGQTGTTPVVFTLAAGSYTVSATYGGQTLTANATVTAGQNTPLNFDFTAILGYITVSAFSDSTAIAASVVADGKTGTTPVTFSFPAGNYNVTTTYQGQTLPAQQITVTAGQTSTVDFHFAMPTITLNAVAGTGGSVSPSGALTLTIGSVYQFTATANTGYVLDHWELPTGTSIGTTTPLNLTAIATMNGQTLTAIFRYILITLTVTAGANGSVSPSGAVTLTIGQTYSFTATPNANYVLDHWELGGVSVGAANPYSLTAASSMNGLTLRAVFAAITITLSVTAGPNGSVSPSGVQTLALGQSYSFAAIPNTGYQLDHWELPTGTSIGSTNPAIITATAAMNGKTLTAFFAVIPPVQITMNVAVNPAGAGSVTPSVGSHQFAINTLVSFTATATGDYIFSHWSLDSLTYTNNPLGLTIASNMNGMTLTAIFVIPQATITVTTGANGTVSPSGSQTMVIGHTYQFTATPNANYHLDHWDLAGANLGSSNPLSLTATATMNGTTLTAIFAVTPITLTVVAGANGSVTPSGSQTLIVGSLYNFTAVATSGYALDHWDLAGVNIGSANPYTLTATVAMNGQTLTALFSALPITLTVTAGTNGSVSPSGTQTLVLGQTYAFAAVPNTGYLLDHWDLSGTNVGSTNPYTLTATSSLNGKTLTVLFSVVPPVQVTITLAVNPSGAGTTVPSVGVHQFNAGDIITFTATSNTGWDFVQWTLNGTAYSGSTLNLPIVTAMGGKTLTANFTPSTITLSATAGTGGTVSPLGIQTLTVGSLYTFTATPNTGYTFSHWELGGVNVSSSNPYQLVAAVSMNRQTLMAIFAAGYITLNIGAGANGAVVPSGAQSLLVGATYQFATIANTGYQIDHWELGGVNIGSTAVLNLTITPEMNNKTLIAYFTSVPIPKVTITLAVNPSDGGATTPAIGVHQFNVGDLIVFTATPAGDYLFSQWDLDGFPYQNNPLQLAIVQGMDGTTLTAHFYIPQVTLDVATGTGGSVSPSGPQTLIIGHTYQFIAIPTAGMQLDYWDLAGTNIGSTNPLNLTARVDMEGKTLTALFTATSLPQITLTVVVNPAGGGTTTPSTGKFNIGDTVEFTATPALGYTFVQWRKPDGTTVTENPLRLPIVTADDGKTLIAEFTSGQPGFNPYLGLLLGLGVAGVAIVATL